jgi:hypothetical protein
MGTLYRKHCENCDLKQNVTFDGFAGAAITEPEEPGDIISGSYLVYLQEEGEPVVLAHPAESSMLHKAGGSWTSATLNGRILRFINLICTDCGTINTTARVDAAGLGCFLGLLTVILAILVNSFLLEVHRHLEFGLVWAAFFGPGITCNWYVRLRHGRNAIPYQFVRCDNCDGNDAIPITASKKRKFPCERCGEKSVTITIAGMS